MDEGAPVTIVFTDVEGSTDLRTRRGDDAAHELLQAHETLVRDSVAEHDGREVKALGDGFMIAFASARKALTCAIAIQRATEAHRRRNPESAVRVRIGVNTGEVLAQEEDLYGQAVNAAARVAGRAKGGEILVAEVTKQLVGSRPEFVFTDRGRLRLKGFPERCRLFELAWPPADGELAGPAGLGDRTPFVGRDAERAELRRLLDAAVAGTGALVMIGGEPGVGKTRLAEELMLEAARRDLDVLAGHSYEREGAAPYVAVVEILEGALARAPSPQAWRAFLGEEAAEIVRLVPRLRQLCPDIPPPLELPPEQERRLLFNNVRVVMERSARRRPLLVLFDDLQWADEPTLFCFEHLVERVAEMPVLIVATYRDTEVDVGRPLAKTFEDLRRRHLARWMALTRLPEEGVAGILRALSGQEPPPELVGAVYSETEGNPFFVEEVYRFLAGEGRLFDEAGRFRTDLSIGELDVPAGVRLVVGRRLQRLDPATLPVLAAAAVAGRAFSVELLESVDGFAPDDVLDAIEDAERARTVTPAPDSSGEDRYIFAHELVRQTLLADLSLTRRRRLHARLADARERLYADNLDRQAAVIAYHLREAGAPAERTFAHLLRAGRWAMEASAYEDALEHFERAATLRDAVQPADWAPLLVELALARRSTGHWDGAMEAWRESVVALEQIGDVVALGRACANAAYSLAYGFRFAEAAELCRRGLDALGDRASADRAHLLDTLGVILSAVGDYQSGAALLDQAMALAAEVGDDSALGHALLSKCVHHWFFLEHDDAATAGFRSAELMRSTGDLFNIAAPLGFVSLSLVYLGRPAEAERVNRELEPLADRLGNWPALLMMRRAAGITEFFRTGDAARLEAFGRDDLAETVRQGLPWVSQGWGWQGTAAFLRGDWERAESHFTEAKRLELQGALHGWDTGVLLQCLAYMGRRSEALALIDDAVAQLPEPGQPMGSGTWTLLTSAVESLIVLGERERAHALYPHVRDGIGRTKSLVGTYYDGRLLERLAAMAGGRWPESEAHFVRALHQAETIPHRVEEAHTRRWYGQMLLERGRPEDREQADESLRAAIAGYERLRMPRHHALATALVATGPFG